MKGFIMLRRAMAALAACTLAISLMGCAAQSYDPQTPEEVDTGEGSKMLLIQVFYPIANMQQTTSGSIIRDESRYIEIAPDATVADYIALAMTEQQKSPDKQWLSDALPEGTRIQWVKVEQDEVHISFSAEFEEANGISRAIARSCTVFTATQFQGIEKVKLYVNGVEMIENGVKIGFMTKDSIISEMNSSPTKTTLTLYFADLEQGKLVAETREVTLEPNESVESRIIAELMAGPDDPRLVNPLPTGTRYLNCNRVSTGNCFLGLSKEFAQGFAIDQSAEDGSQLSPEERALLNTRAQLALFSIVNSYMELNGVKRVYIYVDGSAEFQLGDTQVTDGFTFNTEVVGALPEAESDDLKAKLQQDIDEAKQQDQ